MNVVLSIIYFIIFVVSGLNIFSLIKWVLSNIDGATEKNFYLLDRNPFYDNNNKYHTYSYIWINLYLWLFLF